MKTIWKYTLQETPRQTILMPTGAEILHLDMQKSELCIWARLESENPLEGRVILILGTGDPADGDSKYIDSIQIATRVWHVFDAGVQG